MPVRQWIKSANFAIEGILYAAKTERHIRYHFYSIALVLIVSYMLGISRTEFLLIALVAITVLLAELFNTAIEAVVDLLSPEQNEKARIAKDVAAGAVLITAFGAAVIGYVILFPPLFRSFHEGFHVAKHTGEEISMAAFILVLILVVIAKAYLGKGTPLWGGMPSGHAALAFSAWVAITYLAGSIIVSAITFVLAAAVARNRVTSGIHTTTEVILGGLLGMFVTFLLFEIFL
ncbi:MAG TPA: diacylglycerol kinase [Nitrospiraceae bacterium]|jgi:diacylglycerol kinase (ATP)|nr:diacylglycerol kinase [Nitrospiraceae bacterium]